MNSKLVIAAALLVSAQSWAFTEADKLNLTAQSYSVEEISDETPLATHLVEQVQIGPELLEAGIMIDQIVNIGQKVWDIVEKGRPVASAKMKAASAMPKGVKNWAQMSGWKTPNSKSFRIVYKNKYGVEVVDFTYRVLFTYGGGFKGVGKYVTGAMIIPADLTVLWGWNFSSNVVIPTIVNVGTSEDPVAGIQMDVYWKVETVLFNHQRRNSYFVNGLGALVTLK